MCTLPLVLLVFPFLLWAFAYYREIFVMTTRELKRLEGIGKSPIYAMLSESMSGIATIRVNHKHTYFANKFQSLHNTLINTQFAFIAVSRWYDVSKLFPLTHASLTLPPLQIRFALKLDFLSFCFLATATLSAVVIQHQGWFNLDSAILGLTLSLLLQLASANFPYMVRQSAEISNHMVSVGERTKA
jgi:ATP-binding cassette subfamily C (CFTR/MRP) protein 4